MKVYVVKSPCGCDDQHCSAYIVEEVCFSEGIAELYQKRYCGSSIETFEVKTLVSNDMEGKV